jgi:DNA-binding IclR family transcriptional regulator
MLPAQPNQSLIDGIVCLQAVVSAGAPVGVRQLARDLGLETTRVNRLLKTLAHIGIVRQNDRQRYEPGPGLHILTAQSLRGSGLLTAALPVIRQLANTRLIVALGVLWNNQVCYLYHGRPDKNLETGIGSHGLFPAHVSSIGRILLALQKPALKSLPDKLPSGHQAEPFSQIRKQRFAGVIDPAGVTSLCVPVGIPPIAGLALAGKIDKHDIKTLVKRLHKAAEEIQARISKFEIRNNIK